MLAVLTGCSGNPTASPQEAANDPEDSMMQTIKGTWRKTDGNLFILINDSHIVFYTSNSALENFWEYTYDGRLLSVFSEDSPSPDNLVTIQEVAFDGYQMILTEVVGSGYDGVFDRTGGF